MDESTLAYSCEAIEVATAATDDVEKVQLTDEQKVRVTAAVNEYIVICRLMSTTILVSGITMIPTIQCHLKMIHYSPSASQRQNSYTHVP